jgi:CheY-like chemotaxis protein
MSQEQKALTVLVVDDEADIRWILSTLFSNHNFEIFEASTGREGAEKALKLLPDLVIMDYKMPDINGWEATRLIRESLKKNRDLPSIPIVGYTAFANYDMMKAGKEAGLQEILKKPVDFELWEDIISKYVSRKNND